MYRGLIGAAAAIASQQAASQKNLYQYNQLMNVPQPQTYICAYCQSTHSHAAECPHCGAHVMRGPK